MACSEPVGRGFLSRKRQLKLSIRRPSSWALAGLPAGLLGHCWAVQCSAVQIGPWEGARLESLEGWQEEVKRESQPTPAVSINKANPTVPSGTPHTLPGSPRGAQPSRAMHGTTTYLNSLQKVGRQDRRLTTQSVIVSTRRRREPGSASCHLPRSQEPPQDFRGTLRSHSFATYLSGPRAAWLSSWVTHLHAAVLLAFPWFFLPQTPIPAIAHHARLSFFDLFPAR